MGETKEKRFIRLATARTQKASEAIKNIAKLSNTANYSYNNAQVKKIIRHLKQDIKSLEEAFNTSGPNKFSL